MKKQVLNNNNNNEVGLCSICGTVHTNPEGFIYSRVCRECGEKTVYSITEYMDIVNDYFELKKDYKELNEMIENMY